MAILIIVADDRLRNITGYSTNSDLNTAHDKLIWAQVLAWIAAGLGLILLIGYLLLDAAWLQTEWLHLILWIGVFGALIASGVFLAIALGDINRANVSDEKGSAGYIWGALISGGVALLILLISGGWRIAHRQTYEQGYDMYTPADVGFQTNAPPGDVAEMPPSTSQIQGSTDF